MGSFFMEAVSSILVDRCFAYTTIIAGALWTEGTLMRAFTLDSFESPPGLRDDLPTPTVGADQVLVRVHASSVNGADAAIAAGMLKGMFEYEFPVTLGRDFAGVVEDVGSAATRYQPGDGVYGFLVHADPTVHNGSWAEYVVAADTSVARKPDNVDFATAGAAPLAALTALDALDAFELSEGATVIVIGASGGVGSFFVQLAAAAGANVIAPGLPEDHEYLRGLGANEVIDRNADVAVYVREHYPDGVDALLDVVSQAPNASVLKPGGRLASPLGAAGEGPGRTNLVASSTTSSLERLARLLANGALRVPVQRTYALEQAGTALDALPATHTQGKLALTIA
jgi:NADPH:quinone reductase-like Zn-dependent oxidoreductase